MEGSKTRRHGYRAGSKNPADATSRYSRGETLQAGENNNTRPGGGEASRRGETGVLVNCAEPTVGDGLDVPADLGRRCLRVFHR